MITISLQVTVTPLQYQYKYSNNITIITLYIYINNLLISLFTYLLLQVSKSYCLKSVSAHCITVNTLYYILWIISVQ